MELNSARRRKSSLIRDSLRKSSHGSSADSSAFEHLEVGERQKNVGLFLPGSKRSRYEPVSATTETREPSLKEISDDDSRVSDGTESPSNDNSCNGKNDYYGVWHRYPYYRYYFFSHLCQNMGDWFVRIASLILVTEMASQEGRGLAHLVLASILPKAIFTHVGGVLADCVDRRHMMITLDVISGIFTLGFLFAIQYKSLPALYFVTTLRAACGAMYYPVTTSMVRMLVPPKQDLLLANIMNGWTWSSMAMIGGFLAGSLAAIIGLKTCYIVDSVTFFISAGLLTRIRGSYSVKETTAVTDNGIDPESGEDAPPEDTDSPITAKAASCSSSITDFCWYLWTCGFAALTLLKPTASLVWGPEDIISTGFAEAGTTTDAGKSIRMGLTFTFIGMGCLIGPAGANLLTDTSRPKTLLAVCIVGFCFQLVSWLGMSQTHTFELFLLFTMVRAIGSSIVWLNSTALLQTLSAQQQLGRVLGVEYFCYTVTESIGATAAGNLEDAGVSKNEISLIASGVAALAIIVWGTYYSCRKDLISSSLSLSSSPFNSWQPIGEVEMSPAMKAATAGRDSTDEACHPPERDINHE